MDVRRLCGALVERAAQSPGMNVLVTGGTGFLGSHLIEQLTRQATPGCEVPSSGKLGRVHRSSISTTSSAAGS
jgi:hypothetical protein